MLAAGRGKTECVRVLLEGGADKDASDNVRILSASLGCLYKCPIRFVLLVSRQCFCVRL
jgi:hypothetical protein